MRFFNLYWTFSHLNANDAHVSARVQRNTYFSFYDNNNNIVFIIMYVRCRCKYEYKWCGLSVRLKTARDKKRKYSYTCIYIYILYSVLFRRYIGVLLHFPFNSVNVITFNTYIKTVDPFSNICFRSTDDNVNIIGTFYIFTLSDESRVVVNECIVLLWCTKRKYVYTYIELTIS